MGNRPRCQPVWTAATESWCEVVQGHGLRRIASSAVEHSCKLYVEEDIVARCCIAAKTVFLTM
jgi:hypothetical protein